MNVVCLHDKKLIESFLRKNIYLHIYSIGDLDDFFWPKTIWFAEVIENEIKAIVMLYVGMEIPCLLAFCDNDITPTSNLLNNIRRLLPKQFAAHLSTGLIGVFGEKNIID